MRFLPPSAKLIAISALALSASAYASHVHRGPTAGHRKAASAHKLHGQRSIDGQRATEIQSALIREHYMEGEPSGQWDSATQEAMQRYQADHGWQTKLMPDSRALISLGLGPDHSQNGLQTVPVSSATTGSPVGEDLSAAVRGGESQ